MDKEDGSVSDDEEKGGLVRFSLLVLCSFF